MADVMVAAMQHLPVGYRFHPTDEELLGHYLLRKNLGEEDPVCVIPEVDLCGWEPEELIRVFRESSIFQSKGPQWWFFSEQRPGRTQQRSTKGGFWKKTGQTRDVKSRHGTQQVIGSKKILTFFRGNSSTNTKTNWIMHEYNLEGNALLKGFLMRKNHVLCMIKSNSDDMADSTPSYECEWDEPVTNILGLLPEPEADNGFTQEHMFQAPVQSLETTRRTPNHGGNINMFAPLVETFKNSADSSRTQFWLGGDSIESSPSFSASELLVGDAIESDSSFSSSEFFGLCPIRAQDSSSTSSGWSESLNDILNWALVDQDEHFVSEIPTWRNGTQASEPFVRRRLEPQAVWDENASETLRPCEQPAVIMENKQSQKLERLYAFWPINEKKGIVEDNPPRPTTTVRAEAPEVKIEEECPEIISEARAQRHAPIKIEEISVSAAGSLSTPIHKPGKPVMDATCTARGEETNAKAALIDHENPARELKLEAAETEPSKEALSDHENPARELKLEAAETEPTKAALNDHENPARELKLEAAETEPTKAALNDHENPAPELKLEAAETEPAKAALSDHENPAWELKLEAAETEPAKAALSDHENPAQELKLEAAETEPSKAALSDHEKPARELKLEAAETEPTKAALNDHENPASELKLEAAETEPTKAALSEHENPARELKLEAAETEPAKAALSDHKNPAPELKLEAAETEPAKAALSEHENPAWELKLEAAETEPVSCSCSRSIKQRSSSSQSMVYARNLLMGIILCILIVVKCLNL